MAVSHEELRKINRVLNMGGVNIHDSMLKFENQYQYSIQHDDIGDETGDIESTEVNLIEDLGLERREGILIWKWSLDFVTFPVTDTDADYFVHMFTTKSFTSEPDMMSDDLDYVIGRIRTKINSSKYEFNVDNANVDRSSCNMDLRTCWEVSLGQLTIVPYLPLLVYADFYDTVFLSGTPTATNQDVVTTFLWTPIQITPQIAMDIVDYLQTVGAKETD